MNRRDAITSLSLAGGATLLPKGHSLAESLVPRLSDAYAQAVRGTSAVRTVSLCVRTRVSRITL